MEDFKFFIRISFYKGGDVMGQFVLTAFHASGETLLNERIEAENEAEAKAAGEALLKEKSLRTILIAW